MDSNDAILRIDSAIRQIARAVTKGELGSCIGKEVSRYSIFELQVIGGNVKRETDKLPFPYREKIRPFFDIQLFGMYHRLLVMYRSGSFTRMTKPINDIDMFTRYCEMLKTGCYSNEDASGSEFYLRDPACTLFYYLISGFTMFVLDEPGHPVGTPFPGGFTVEKKGNDYFCPIRDKEEEILFSICNFCPAKQMEGV